MYHKLLLVFAVSSLFSLFALIGPSVYSQVGNQNFVPALTTNQSNADDSAGCYPSIVYDKSICNVSDEVFSKTREKDKVVQAMAMMERLVNALLHYAADNKNKFPSTEQGLKALFEKPLVGEVPANWDGPYLDGSLRKDPWGNPYIYERSKKDGYTLTSYGKSGKAGGDIEITCNVNVCRLK